MSNIYWKATIEKNLRSHNFDFSSLKYLSPGQFLGYHRILKLKKKQLKNHRSGSKTVCGVLLF